MRLEPGESPVSANAGRRNMSYIEIEISVNCEIRHPADGLIVRSGLTALPVTLEDVALLLPYNHLRMLSEIVEIRCTTLSLVVVEQSFWLWVRKIVESKIPILTRTN